MKTPARYVIWDSREHAWITLGGLSTLRQSAAEIPHERARGYGPRYYLYPVREQEPPWEVIYE